VVEPFEHAETFLDHRVARLTVQVHEHTHAAIGPLAPDARGGQWRAGMVVHE
jgi:hypothetical protein